MGFPASNNTKAFAWVLVRLGSSLRLKSNLSKHPICETHLIENLHRYAMEVHISDTIMRKDSRMKAITDETVVNICMLVHRNLY
jgi:hypothetical protein